MDIGKRALNAVINSGLNSQPDDISKGSQIMKTNAFKRALLPAAIVASFAGMAGIGGNALAAPSVFTATATVVGAIPVAQTTPLNFGTVFATKTAVPATTLTTTASNKFTLNPTTGAVTLSAGAASVAMVVLGGTPTAGVFNVASLPSGGIVQILISDSNGLSTYYTSAELAAFTASTATCIYDDSVPAIAAFKVALTNSADPLQAFFCVDGFTTDRTGLLTTTGYTLPFGTTTLTFNLGATLISQAPTTGLARTYQAGAYTGTFGLEIAFH
jgi:hypothetical protein